MATVENTKQALAKLAENTAVASMTADTKAATRRQIIAAAKVREVTR